MAPRSISGMGWGCSGAGGELSRVPVGLCPAPGSPPVPPQVPSVQDTVQEHLGQVRAGGAQALPERERAELKRRKLLLEV